MGRQQPATGSHLPLEETVSPFAVSPDFTATQVGRDFASGLPCQAPSEGTPQSAARGTLRSRDRAAAGMSRPRQELAGAFASRCGVASSSGRDCSALRGRTIRVVAFRASHPAKPPSLQLRLVQGFPNSSREPASEPYRTSGVRSPPSKPFKRRRDHRPIPLSPAPEMCPPFSHFPGDSTTTLHPSHLRSAILTSAFNPVAARLESYAPNGPTSSATRPG
jgi:hypothetical protein